MRTTDETGLCSPDCDCPRCEAGFRPSERERAIARRSLALAIEARRRIAERDEPKTPGTYPTVQWWARRVPSPKPYNEEEKAELAAMRAEFGRRGRP
jgi:hypothetical protein